MSLIVYHSISVYEHSPSGRSSPSISTACFSRSFDKVLSKCVSRSTSDLEDDIPWCAGGGVGLDASHLVDKILSIPLNKTR